MGPTSGCPTPTGTAAAPVDEAAASPRIRYFSGPGVGVVRAATLELSGEPVGGQDQDLELAQPGEARRERSGELVGTEIERVEVPEG